MNYVQLMHQGVANPAHSMMNKGGSDSPSNPDTRYANLDALYGTQNRASNFMLDNALPHIPRLTENSAGMVDEAMSGLLSQRARNQAGADAEQSFSSNMAAIDRNLGKYGAEFNGNRMSALNRNAATEGALAKATAMNKASQWGEDQKWNRNASFYGQVMGMNNGAMSGLSSAGSGLSNLANQQNANDAANAKGYGQAGAAFSNALFKADGGEVRAPRLASGGNAWEAYKSANPVTPMVTGGSSRRGRTNPYMAMLSGAAPQMLGAGLRDVMNLDGKGGKIAGGLKKGYNWLNEPSKNAVSFTPENTPGVTYGGDIGADTPIDWSTYGSGADAGMAATEMGSAVAAYDSTGAPVGVTYGGDIGADGVSSAASAGSAVSAAGEGASWIGDGGSTFGSILNMASGGAVKRAQGLALGGMPSMQKMSVADNSGVAGLDSNQSMSVARMGTTPTKQQNAKPVVDTTYSGRTDGNGEMSDGDPDGFGSQSGDKRHIAGTTTLKIVGNNLFPFLGTVAGDLVADTIHPVMEQATRNSIMFGDKLGRETLGGLIGRDAGGFAGAFGVDPIGTVMSGKYFAQGGDVEPGLRRDFRPGGKVTGPGTETSDDIPAWLSQGEFVVNAEAVKMVGKDKLEKINNAGLKRRKAKAKSKAGTGLKKGR